MSEQSLQAIAFPTLNEEQVAALGRCAGASLKRYKDGDVLFSVCDHDFKFYVVKSGAIEILDPSGDAPKTITIHRPGEFTGDISHLTGNPSIVTGIARGDCEVFEMPNETLRQVLNQCPDTGDIVLQAFIARRQLLRESGNFTGLRVIGSHFSRDSFRIRDFLARNRVLFTFLDLESQPDVAQLLQQFGIREDETPIVAFGTKLVFRNPSNRELADAIGIRRPLEQTVYDLAVVGAGPAGLAAAVYGASEGLNTVVLERTAPGGQAATSMRIENYLGFPTGLTGAELADRAVIQANKFGAVLSVPTPVASLEFENAYALLRLDTGESLTAKCLLIATGAEYRRLGVEGCDQYEGCGVYYAATHIEAQECRGAEVIVVGGGNSAGQAAVFLSGQTRKVHLVLRDNSLHKSMSAYLARRIEQTSNIEIHFNTLVHRMIGNGRLTHVELQDKKTAAVISIATPALFSFIGASPRTEWLPAEIEKDARGFVRTGPSLIHSASWTARRDPFLLETSRRGVFAAGDVRAESVKRVASAVGEGAMAVQFVHAYLREM